MKITHNELKDLIKTAYNKKLPAFVWGATGIGKSYTIRDTAMELAKELGLEYSEDIQDINKDNKFMLIDIRISQLDPSDLRGLPDLDREKGETRWLLPNWLPRKGHGIIFFDELNLAPPSIQASAYQLILDRRLGDYVLPDGYIIVSAGNRLEDKAHTFEMANPLKNRFIHTELAIPIPEQGNIKSGWLKWASENGIDTRILTYIAYLPSELYKFEEASKSPAFPTPRSWEYASKLIDEIKNKEVIRMLVSSAVGDASANKFVEFIEIMESINLDEIMKNPEKAREVESIEQKFALLSLILETYKSKPEKLDTILEIARNIDKEYLVFTMITIAKMDEKAVNNIVKYGNKQGLMKEIADVMFNI